MAYRHRNQAKLSTGSFGLANDTPHPYNHHSCPPGDLWPGHHRSSLHHPSLSNVAYHPSNPSHRQPPLNLRPQLSNHSQAPVHPDNTNHSNTTSPASMPHAQLTSSPPPQVQPTTSPAAPTLYAHITPTAHRTLRPSSKTQTHIASATTSVCAKTPAAKPLAKSMQNSTGFSKCIARTGKSKTPN
jgi:hypothetical protein